MSLLENLIDEDVLADARKIDKLTRKYDPGRPSIEKTLRLVRDVNTDVVRRVGREVWGVGGTEGADLVRTSFDSCVTELDRAVTQASAWTGEAKNAYGDRPGKPGSGPSSAWPPRSWACSWPWCARSPPRTPTTTSMSRPVRRRVPPRPGRCRRRGSPARDRTEELTVHPENDPLSVAQRMKERIAKIKEDPGRALFSDFKATSVGGVTVSVDLLGRLKRVQLRPGMLYEGAEPWLIEEIMSAYGAAVTAANYLEFDSAEFARELDEAPGLKARLEATSSSADRSSRDRDEFFEQETFLRRGNV